MRPSFRNQVAIWFVIAFVGLYLTAALVVLGVDARNARRELEFFLYAQAESLATYVATTGSLDFPELEGPEAHTPAPVWLRLFDARGTVAETPGSPPLPADLPAPEEGALQVWEAEGGSLLARVRHSVWTREGLFAEAITTSALLHRRRRDLLFALGLAGVVLIPLAALGGRLLAARALRPLEHLVRSIRRLDSRRLGARLATPGAVEEIALVTAEFNSLLGRLEQSVESMRRFTADASHELRTPVSSLRAGLEIALRKERSGEEYRQVLEENLEELTRVQRIVEGLLALARDESAEAPVLSDDVVDLAGVVDSALDILRGRAAGARIELRQNVERPCPVRGDVDQLRLLVLNLLDNALKFTPEGGRATVTLTRSSGQIRLGVRDTGPGVDRADAGRIFQRFYRGRGAGPSERGAGGLGLSLVAWAAERHGGTVRLLESETPGAAFEVLLPEAARPPGS